MRAPAGAALSALLCGCVLANPDYDGSAETAAQTSTTLTASESAPSTVDMTGGTVATGPTSTTSAESTTTLATDATATDSTTSGAATTTGEATTTTGEATTGEPCTPSTPQEAGPELVLAPEFSGAYAGFVLGQVPGFPPSRILGGIAVAEDDAGTLLVAGDAETANGGLFQIGIVRGECGHIIAYDGEATLVTKAEYISHILVLSGGPILYSEWESNFLTQLVEGINTPLRTDLGELTPPVPKSVAGFGLVPPGLAAAGELRVLSWNTGDWYHVVRQSKGDSFDFSDPTYISSLPDKSGGVAYVPAGSPGFAEPHVVITRPEEPEEHVVVYRVDAQGDPLLGSRKVLLDQLPLASNAYFDRVTGDLLLSTLEAKEGDRIYIVQGFAEPPPLQE